MDQREFPPFEAKLTGKHDHRDSLLCVHGGAA